MKTNPINTEQTARFITQPKLCERWDCPPMFIWRKRKKGELTAFKFGARGVRFALADVERIEAQARA